MQLYKKILVTMDCSPVDDNIISHIARVALQNDSTVYLLHVIHSHTLDQDRALRKCADTSLGRHREELNRLGLETHIILKSGEPDEQILKVIEESDFDLVAMATHGHSFIGDILFGSVSRTLKHKIKVPLLIIGPQ